MMLEVDGLNVERVGGAAREICSLLIEAATRRSDELPATRPLKPNGSPSAASEGRCYLTEISFCRSL